MTLLDVVKTIHLLAASVWTGGLIVLGVLVFALRKAGAERPLLQASARAFANASWTAMVVAALSGAGMVDMMHLGWDHPKLRLKLGLVVAAAALAAFHQGTARDTPPAVRGIFEVLILLVSVAIFGAAARIM